MGTHFRDLLPDVWQPSPQSVHRAGKEEGDQPDRVAEPVTQDLAKGEAIATRLYGAGQVTWDSKA